jgi:NADH-quinone oxidoreductase subunit M
MTMIVLLSLLFGIKPNLMTDLMGVAALQLMEPVKTLAQMGVI